MHLQRIFSKSAFILGIVLALPVILAGILALLLFAGGSSDLGLPNLEKWLPSQQMKR